MRHPTSFPSVYHFASADEKLGASVFHQHYIILNNLLCLTLSGGYVGKDATKINIHVIGVAHSDETLCDALSHA
ncbi:MULTISPECIES: hypothetical protein [Alteromonas]|uniref:hypothetical protein n=1 Tax=Alteromonas TaxID=226 RepID=UPI0013568CFD|nr:MULTISPECIES: hypothetical protein [Alteromonas]